MSGVASARRVIRVRDRLPALAAVAVAIAVVGSLLAAGLSRDPERVRSVVDGRPAPDFALATVDGRREVRLSELRGRIVIVNFWASWCVPCKTEAPQVQRAWERYRDEGVVILGVIFQDNPGAAQAFAGLYRLDYPLLRDPDSRTGLAYGVFGIPETFFIDRAGKIAVRHIGPISYEQLVEGIARVSAGSAP